MHQISKRKAAMVLHQIEESLGNFVLKNGNVESLNSTAIQNIHSREADKGRLFNIDSIKDVIEATYLDEIFRFAIDITRDTSLSDSINYLYGLFHQLDIYEIRNAISHPNRTFWECYWYRVAVIASDPVNDILGLVDIKSSLQSAEKGIIADPPEEWIHKVIWEIPNNLPTSFDHGLTGLIGRSRELKELKKQIANPRIHTIALVAPGGAGKTALALDLLNEIVSTPSFSKAIDTVLYVTLKIEKLTAQGVVPLDAVETIYELKSKIVEDINQIFDEEFEEYSDAVEAYSSKNVLLCIDNLETLLRDNPNTFEEINNNLPPAWQVLVTSRVTVSNASVMALDVLNEQSAVHLARTYYAKRGGDLLDDNLYRNVAKSCFYNPLAIRLSLDLLISGRELPESIHIANKEIAEFSYNNLIEVLSVEAIEILEAIFVEDSSTRLSLCELLDFSLERVSESIIELSKTSLITRKSSEQGETYNLSDSVRELLVVAPRNIDVRGKVQNLIRKRRELSREIDLNQNVRRFPVWHKNYLPKDTNENLKILMGDVFKALPRARKDTKLAVSLYRKLKEASFMYEDSGLYHRAFAQVLELLKDFSSAETHYKKAISLNNKDVASSYLLARHYHNSKRYEKALLTYQSLIDDGWAKDTLEGKDFGKTILKGYFLAHLFSGQFDSILELTEKWKESNYYRDILGSYRANALKRMAELTLEKDPANTVNLLIRAKRITGDVFRNNGYAKTVCIQARKLFEEIEYCFMRDDYSNNFKAEGKELLDFIADNILEIASLDDTIVNKAMIEKLSSINIPNNPFNSSKWNAHNIDQPLAYDTEEYSSRGLVTVKITNRPVDQSNFLFAEDAYNSSYFLHVDNLKDGNWQDWIGLSTGQKLTICPALKNANLSKATNADEIYIFEH